MSEKECRDRPAPTNLMKRLRQDLLAISKLRREETGGVMVEFAIITGLVLSPLLLGIVSFGLAAWAKNSATSDAREGARYAIVHGAAAGIVADSAAVANFVKGRTSLETTGPNAIRVRTRWPTGNLPGATVEVSVAHDVPRREPFFIRAHTDSATSKMVILF